MTNDEYKQDIKDLATGIELLLALLELLIEDSGQTMEDVHISLSAQGGESVDVSVIKVIDKLKKIITKHDVSLF